VVIAQKCDSRPVRSCCSPDKHNSSYVACDPSHSLLHSTSLPSSLQPLPTSLMFCFSGLAALAAHYHQTCRQLSLTLVQLGVFILQSLPPVCLLFTSSLFALLLFALLLFCFASIHFHSYSCYCTRTCYSIVTYMYIGHYQQWDPHFFLFGSSARDIAEPSIPLCNRLTLDPLPVLSLYAILVCPLPAVALTRPDNINLNN